MTKYDYDSDVPFYMDNNNANIIALWGVVSSSGMPHQLIPRDQLIPQALSLTLQDEIYKCRFKTN